MRDRRVIYGGGVKELAQEISAQAAEGFVVETVVPAAASWEWEATFTTRFDAAFLKVIASDVIIKPSDVPIDYYLALMKHVSRQAKVYADTKKLNLSTPTGLICYLQELCKLLQRTLQKVTLLAPPEIRAREVEWLKQEEKIPD